MNRWLTAAAIWSAVSVALGVLLASTARWIKDHDRRLAEHGRAEPVGDVPNISTIPVHTIGDRDV